MQKFLGQVQVAVMDAPYDQFQSSLVQQLLTDALSLKLISYQEVYPDGVLPLDSYDFISTHHLVGSVVNGGFQPLMVYRTITLERCDHHRIVFPGLAVLRASGADEHAEVLERSLNQWRATGESVSYGSGWAIAPEVRVDRDLRNFLKDLMTAMLVKHELGLGTDHLVACGAAKVHTDEYFQNIGYQRMQKDGVDLPPFPQASLIGVNAVLLHTDSFNDRALALAREYSEFWTSRRSVSAESRRKVA